MRVVVPALADHLHPSVVPAILAAGHRCEVVPVVGDHAYYEVFSELWRAGEDFMLVEHDVEIGAGMIEEMESCPEPWCANSYVVFWGDCMERFGVPGLGCTRFRAELMAAYPELPDNIALTDMGTGQGPMHWMELDGAVGQWLRGPWKYTAHRHHPNATHHHQYDYEGAWVPADVRATLAPDHPLALPSRVP